MTYKTGDIERLINKGEYDEARQVSERILGDIFGTWNEVCNEIDEKIKSGKFTDKENVKYGESLKGYKEADKDYDKITYTLEDEDPLLSFSMVAKRLGIKI